MAYKHQVSTSEVPTSLAPVVSVSAGLPIVIGTAPINMIADPQGAVNKPLLCYSYAEAVAALGYSDDWECYTLCEFMSSHFGLFNVAPVVFINVLDPEEHSLDVAASDVTLVADVYEIPDSGVLHNSVVVQPGGGGTDYVLNDDYTLTYRPDGDAFITIVPGGGIPAGTTTLNIGYSVLIPSGVSAADIVGGVNPTTLQGTGLELISEVYPRFGLVPGIICAPKWSTDETVAATMKAKCYDINSVFQAICLVDLLADDSTDGAANYQDAAALKTDNNLIDPAMVVCWPKVKLGNNRYHLSTQLAGVINKLDGENGDVPYMSPSNHNLQCSSAVVEIGGVEKEVFLGVDTAAYLNGQGVVTALNFVGGWKAWGNRTSVYPSVTDPKDAFTPIRRMMNWIRNTIILSTWQRLDAPINRRLVETITDSLNIWMNGLAAREYILGGRVEFSAAENPATDLLDGIIRYHVYVTPPAPARDIEFIVEYDVSYLAGLFG